ncbi:MAG: hypothetical protein RQ745_03575, partial [Longimicrobiales bacterium]|nr:hypothetical protein [Longimicrobiales bacterium]
FTRGVCGVLIFAGRNVAARFTRGVCGVLIFAGRNVAACFTRGVCSAGCAGSVHLRSRGGIFPSFSTYPAVFSPFKWNIASNSTSR